MNNIKKGVPMIKLGIAFIIAGVFGQGAELLIRIALLDLGGLEDVGLYNSGYVMAVTYASVVFVAIEADYFPRLSASCSDKTKMKSKRGHFVRVFFAFVRLFPIARRRRGCRGGAW